MNSKMNGDHQQYSDLIHYFCNSLLQLFGKIIDFDKYHNLSNVKQLGFN